jgi:hypothetical protein
LPIARAGEPDLRREGRVVATDHGAFVLINVYAPNAGDRPGCARLGFKLRWFAALRERVEGLLAEGRQVVVAGDLNIPRSRRDVHPGMPWDGLYSAEACRCCCPDASLADTLHWHACLCPAVCAQEDSCYRKKQWTHIRAQNSSSCAGAVGDGNACSHAARRVA